MANYIGVPRTVLLVPACFPLLAPSLGQDSVPPLLYRFRSTLPPDVVVKFAHIDAVAAEEWGQLH